MVKITRGLVEQGTVTETEVHRFVTEASTLGLSPGSFPALLETELGNGLPFTRQRTRPDGSVIYQQHFGCVQLVVFND
jgi:hypothetical protein